MKITINKKQFELKFKWAFFRLLAEKWGLEYVQQVFAEIENMEGREMDRCVDILHAAVQASGQEGADAVTLNDVGDWVFDNLDKIPALTAEIAKSIKGEQQEEPGKPKPPMTAEAKPENP